VPARAVGALPLGLVVGLARGRGSARRLVGHLRTTATAPTLTRPPPGPVAPPLRRTPARALRLTLLFRGPRALLSPRTLAVLAALGKPLTPRTLAPRLVARRTLAPRTHLPRPLLLRAPRALLAPRTLPLALRPRRTLALGTLSPRGTLTLGTISPLLEALALRTLPALLETLALRTVSAGEAVALRTPVALEAAIARPRGGAALARPVSALEAPGGLEVRRQLALGVGPPDFLRIPRA
jgi:hypothetical protein